MGEIGGVEGESPGNRDLGGPPGMDAGRGETADPRVAVPRVVPGGEGGSEGPGLIDRAEARRRQRQLHHGAATIALV
jgi:hypothetical protein